MLTIRCPNKWDPEFMFTIELRSSNPREEWLKPWCTPVRAAGWGCGPCSGAFRPWARKTEGRNVGAGSARYNCQLPAPSGRSVYKHFNQLSLLTANQSQSEIQRDQPASVSLLENIPHVNRCSCLSSLLPYHSDNNITQLRRRLASAR